MTTNKIFHHLIKRVPDRTLKEKPELDYKPSVIILDSNVIIELEKFYKNLEREENRQNYCISFISTISRLTR